MFVIAGSASTHATSPGANAASQRVDVVERDDLRRERRINRRAHAPFARDDVAGLVEHDEGLVDGAVVAPIEDENLLAVRRLAREPEREPVRVGCARRDLPERQPESASELLTDGRRVLGREHERDATLRLLRDHGDRGCRGVPGHRAGIAQTEVDVLVPVDVDDPRSRCHGRKDGEPPGPAGHPVHRHATEQRRRRPSRELAGRGMALGEALFLGRDELGEALTVDHWFHATRIVRGAGYCAAMAEIRAEITANVWQVVAEEGQMVAEGDEICILESMKMEIPVITEVPGVVRELYVEPAQVVQEGDLIALIDES